MKKLSIIVPADSAIAHYLSHQPVAYRITEVTSSSVIFSYLGSIQPLSRISLLITFFDPSEYTIEKSASGFFFIVWSKE